MVTTTVAKRAEADALAKTLVAARLAACVQILEIDSVYRWRDTIEAASECQLMIKARAVDFEAIEDAIRARHSYEVPEIVAMPIVAGSAPYLAWITGSTER